MKAIGITISVIIAVALVVLVTLVWTALAVGAGNAWVLEGTFSDGWNAVWGRKLVSFGWALIFLGSSSASVKASR